jgi:hypothetical protein
MQVPYVCTILHTHTSPPNHGSYQRYSEEDLNCLPRELAPPRTYSLAGEYHLDHISSLSTKIQSDKGRQLLQGKPESPNHAFFHFRPSKPLGVLNGITDCQNQTPVQRLKPSEPNSSVKAGPKGRGLSEAPWASLKPGCYFSF